jgi:hypothetical protein
VAGRITPLCKLVIGCATREHGYIFVLLLRFVFTIVYTAPDSHLLNRLGGILSGGAVWR